MNYCDSCVGVSKLEVQHQLPIASEEQIIQQYEQAFQQNPNIKLALIGEYSMHQNKGIVDSGFE